MRAVRVPVLSRGREVWRPVVWRPQDHCKTGCFGEHLFCTKKDPLPGAPEFGSVSVLVFIFGGRGGCICTVLMALREEFQVGLATSKILGAAAPDATAYWMRVSLVPLLDCLTPLGPKVFTERAKEIQQRIRYSQGVESILHLKNWRTVGKFVIFIVINYPQIVLELNQSHSHLLAFCAMTAREQAHITKRMIDLWMAGTWGQGEQPQIHVTPCCSLHFCVCVSRRCFQGRQGGCLPL